MARAPTQLPGGRHGLARSFVVSNQRERMFAAVADTVAERGYAGLTVAEVVRRAGVSRRTFYDQFAGRRDAFFAAYDASVQQVMESASAGFAAGESWPEQIRLALRASLGFLANDLPFTRMAIVDVPLAGPEGQARQLAGRAVFEVFLAPGAELSDHPVPALVPKAVGSGIFELIHARVVRGRLDELPALLPACVYQCIAPYLGLEAAVREARLAEGEAVA
ncbi:MAG TPA: TetR/AcrR family transcriptional regulator [Methylomirabilota bacterium]|nr:TetR/AcrR family transcriptional regulator [Methylomirabilota bacterium]